MKKLFEIGLIFSLLISFNSLTAHDAKIRIEEFNTFITRDQPLILVFDHLDLLYKDTDKSLKITQLIADITQQAVVPLDHSGNQ